MLTESNSQVSEKKIKKIKKTFLFSIEKLIVNDHLLTCNDRLTVMYKVVNQLNNLLLKPAIFIIPLLFIFFIFFYIPV